MGRTEKRKTQEPCNSYKGSSEPCDGMEVNTHINELYPEKSHAWCVKCGTKRDIPNE